MTLPGFVTCPTCGGRPYFIGGSVEPCPADCVAGQVPSPETVERVAVPLVLDDYACQEDPEDGLGMVREALLEYARIVQEGEK